MVYRSEHFRSVNIIQEGFHRWDELRQANLFVSVFINDRRKLGDREPLTYDVLLQFFLYS